jgi:hypothetical protein
MIGVGINAHSNYESARGARSVRVVSSDFSHE